MEAHSVDWQSLQIESVLNVDTANKHTALLASVVSNLHPGGCQSLILAQGLAFDRAATFLDIIAMCTRGAPSSTTEQCQLAPGGGRLDLIAQNDIYFHYMVRWGTVEVCKVTLVHPCTSTHISKYRKQTRHLIEESPQLHTAVTRPYIEGRVSGDGHLRWIENILAGTSEQECIIADVPDALDGFVILPDSKWDRATMASLYYLAIIRRRDVHTLRDLCARHLPLLRAIRAEALARIPQRHPEVGPTQLRLFIHYLPTYYYFHIHIVHVDWIGGGCAVGAAHLLDDVIDNIANIDGDYYAKRTLTFTVGEEHVLFPALCRSPS